VTVFNAVTAGSSSGGQAGCSTSATEYKMPPIPPYIVLPDKVEISVGFLLMRNNSVNLIVA
jgi:hypothetical protein